MSITIDWASLTTGPSGLALADSIRHFIHDKFQQVALPRFIRSVHVHTFDFGEECPVVELKDISDPLPEFYERDEDSSSSSEEDGVGEEEAIGGGGTEAAETSTTAPKQQQQERQRQRQQQPTQSHKNPPPAINTRLPNLHLRSSGLPFPPPSDQISTPFLSRSNATTPGIPIPGGTSNFSYFHLPLSSSSSGAGLTQTPLMPWGEQQSQREQQRSYSPLPNAKNGPMLKPTALDLTNSHHHQQHQQKNPPPESQHPLSQPPNPRTTKTHHPPSTPPSTDRSQDLQTTLHISYQGTLSLSLTAEILLDYPMPSFVGIPLKLQITGLSFDGVALLAYLRHRNGGTSASDGSGGNGHGNKGSEGEEDGEGEERKKVHFCFLGREDASAMLGPDSHNQYPDDEGDDGGQGEEKEQQEKERQLGNLLHSIRIESQIGRQENGKQVLKNVGKVEKFVLEQVRRIFEEEFVWPSFWTFLI